jgi:hypothetical protein
MYADIRPIELRVARVDTKVRCIYPLAGAVSSAWGCVPSRFAATPTGDGDVQG